MKTQLFSHARQFADNAFAAQAALLKSCEQITALQLAALERHAAVHTAFVAEVLDALGGEQPRSAADATASAGKKAAR